MVLRAILTSLRLQRQKRVSERCPSASADSISAWNRTGGVSTSQSIDASPKVDAERSSCEWYGCSSLLSPHGLEFLHSPAIHFGNVNVAFRIHSNSVGMVKLAGEMRGATPKTRQNLPRVTIENIDFFVGLIGHVDVSLVRIGRKIQRHG